MKHSHLIRDMRNCARTWFKTKGYGTRPPSNDYILDDWNDWPKNILEDRVSRRVRDLAEHSDDEHPFALHRWVHHGLSSQACCFNLLGPMVVDEEYALLGQMLDLANPSIKIAGSLLPPVFEYTNMHVLGEQLPQPTSVDLLLTTTAGERIYIEFKFTETEFGTCSVYEAGDCDGANPWENLDRCYLHREKHRLYMKLMKQHGLLSGDESCPFTEFYQAYRLLLLALQEEESARQHQAGTASSTVLVIHDDRNPSFLRNQGTASMGKYVRFKNRLTPETANKVSILSVQDIVDALEQSRRAPWIEAFKERYCIQHD